MTTRSSPGSNCTARWTASSSCSLWKCPSPKFQPVTMPEIDLALAHEVVVHVARRGRAREQGVEGAAVAVHRPEGEPLLEDVVRGVRVVDLRSAARPRSARPCRSRGRTSPPRRCPCGTATCWSPSCPRSSASTAGRRSCPGRRFPTIGITTPISASSTPEQRIVEVPERHVAVLAEQEAEPEDHEQVPLHRDAHRERREDVDVEHEHADQRDRPDRAAVREQQEQRHAELPRGAQVRARTPPASTAAGPPGSPGTSSTSSCASGSRACC